MNVHTSSGLREVADPEGAGEPEAQTQEQGHGRRQPASSARLRPSFDGVAKVAHVGPLLAADDQQEDREDQPEPAVRSRLEGGVQSGALRALVRGGR